MPRTSIFDLATTSISTILPYRNRTSPLLSSTCMVLRTICCRPDSNELATPNVGADQFGSIFQGQAREFLQHAHFRIVATNQNSVGHSVQIHLYQGKVQETRLRDSTVVGIMHYVPHAR